MKLCPCMFIAARKQQRRPLLPLGAGAPKQEEASDASSSKRPMNMPPAAQPKLPLFPIPGRNGLGQHRQLGA